MKSIVRKMLIGFFSVSFILLYVATITYLSMGNLVQREIDDKNSLKIMNVIENIQMNALDIETGMRGYLIVGDTSFLPPYNKGKANINANLDTLQRIINGNNLYKQNGLELDKYCNLLLDVSEQLVFDEKMNRTDTIKRHQLLYASKRYMDEIRVLVSEIEERERVQLQITAKQTIKKALLAKFGYLTTALLSIIILVAVFFIVRKELNIRIKTERKLQESSERIYNLYNKAPCGYHSVNNDFVVVEINETELNWLGYTKEDVLGKMSIYDFIQPKDHYKLEHAVSLIHKGEKKTIQDLEVCYVRKDGSCFEVLLNSTIIFDKQGNAIATRTAVLDITKLKESQDKIQALYKELEENNNQLLMANEELESFTYSVSHDLRAPLRAIDGYCKILQEDYSNDLDNEGQRVLSTIMNNSHKMGVLIDDLLDFSRLGRKELSLIEVDHNSILSEVINESSIPLNTIIEIDTLIKSRADRNLIKQVWSNLVSNAVKYSSKELKPTIHINSYTDNEEVVYCIEDNGVGFEEKYKHKLFQVFQRLHHEEEFDGTGVGLAIVHKIITKHKGRVWAESNKNGKTKFSFSLPT